MIHHIIHEYTNDELLSPPLFTTFIGEELATIILGDILSSTWCALHS